MKAVIEVSEETLDKLAETLNLDPLYDSDYGVDEEMLEYAVKTIAEICMD